MTASRITFEILTWWHMGTGRGDGPVVDAVVARSAEGLPFIPGRTVKGLVREAVVLAVEAGLASRKEEVEWFGTGLLDQRTSAGADRPAGTDDRERRLEENRFATAPGTLRFESATLGDGWSRWAAGSPANVLHLFSTIAATKITASGVADDKTLRVVEVAVPMTLLAPVEGLTPRSAQVLTEALPVFLRGIGSHRHRGLGRVAASLEVM